MYRIKSINELNMFYICKVILLNCLFVIVLINYYFWLCVFGSECILIVEFINTKYIIYLIIIFFAYHIVQSEQIP
jgi:hypothetical protein